MARSCAPHAPGAADPPLLPAGGALPALPEASRDPGSLRGRADREGPGRGPPWPGRAPFGSVAALAWEPPPDPPTRSPSQAQGRRDGGLAHRDAPSDTGLAHGMRRDSIRAGLGEVAFWRTRRTARNRGRGPTQTDKQPTGWASRPDKKTSSLGESAPSAPETGSGRAGLCGAWNTWCARRAPRQ